MSVVNNKIWISDIDEVTHAMPEIEQLAGKTVMITGPSGLICSALIDILVRWNVTHDEKVTIIAAGRSEKKIRNRFHPFDAEEWFCFLPYDAASLENAFPLSCDYIIHGASNASPAFIMREPVETMLSNVFGLRFLLEFAKERDVRRVLYISSSEVYGKKEGDQPFKNDEYGYIDLLNARNSYSVGKRAAETLCASYAEEYGVDSVIARPGHIYGPTALPTDNRVSSLWPHAAANGRDIIMKSDGRQIRSYCYCLDCATALLKVLLNGESVHAYNISNPDSIISIREMAEIIAEVSGVKVQMEAPSPDEVKGFNPMSNSSLDSIELLELGWRGQFDAYRGFDHTVRIIRELERH